MNVNISEKEQMSIQTNYSKTFNLKENNIISSYINIDNIIKIFNIGYVDWPHPGSSSSCFSSNIIVDKFGNIYEYIGIEDSTRATITSGSWPSGKFIQLNEKKELLLNDIIIDCINKIKPFSQFMYCGDYNKSLKCAFITMIELLVNFNHDCFIDQRQSQITKEKEKVPVTPNKSGPDPGPLPISNPKP
jgi:hypothetical protein